MQTYRMWGKVYIMAKSRGKAGRGKARTPSASPRKRRPQRTMLNGLMASHKWPQSNWANDFDYLHKLSPGEKAWLNDFAEEYYCSKSKAKLHSQDQLRERWKAYKQNARDVMSRGRETLAYTGEGGKHDRRTPSPVSQEDAAIAQIDARRARARAADDASPTPPPIGSVWLN